MRLPGREVAGLGLGNFIEVIVIRFCFRVCNTLGKTEVNAHIIPRYCKIVKDFVTVKRGMLMTSLFDKLTLAEG